MIFFPLFHALALEKKEDEAEKQLKELRNMVEKLLKRNEEEVIDCMLNCITVIAVTKISYPHRENLKM